jgi:CRP/FNR family cyclic AMP-dependent transcriptional regulator
MSDGDLVRECVDGECIFREGDPTQEMYVVQSGEVLVSKNTVDGPVLLATLGRGSFLGEMSLLESLPRSANAHARGKTKLLRIQSGGFLLKIRRDPTFAFELMQSLSQRVRLTNERLMEAVRKGDLGAVRKLLEEQE